MQVPPANPALHRLCFTAPDTGVASRLVATLETQAGVPRSSARVIARVDVPLEDLPEASPNETADVMPAVRRGIVAGGAVGLLAGLLAMNFPPAGLQLGGAAVLALGGMGAGFGMAIAAIVGSSVPHTDLQDFADAVDDGRVLTIVEVPAARVDAVAAVVQDILPGEDIKDLAPALEPSARA